MFRTIIVGYDGSPASEAALALAVELCDPVSGRLVVATVAPPAWAMAVPGVPIPDAEILRTDAMDVLARADDSLGGDLPHRLVALSDSSAPRALEELATSEAADLIVLGSTHRQALGRLTGRTTVQRLLHGAPCAVAVAATGHLVRLREGSHVAVAYDGSPEARRALDTAYGIAEQSGAEVDVLFVLEPPASFESVASTGLKEEVWDVLLERAHDHVRTAAEAAPAGVTVHRHVLRGPTVATLLQGAAHADLLIAGSRGYGALHRVLAGSVSTGLLTDGHLPVLVVPRGASGTGAGDDQHRAGGVVQDVL